MFATPSARRLEAWPARARDGFTLLELLAALAVSGLVAIGARRLVAQLGEAEERVRLEQAAFMTRINGERLARSVVARAEAAPPPDGRFAGASTGASFLSWCLAPAGWLERCRATLAVTVSSDSSVVVLRAGLDQVVASRHRGAATLLYYDARQPSEPWSTSWTSDAALPDAIGIAFREPPDTLVLPTGAR